MGLQRVSKMIGGGVGAAAGSAAGLAGLATIAIPEHIEAPWWAFVLVGILNVAATMAAIYKSPANAPPVTGPVPRR